MTAAVAAATPSTQSATPPNAAKVTGLIEQVELGPPFKDRYLCVEHALELEHAGDALGTDCVLSGGVEIGSNGFLRLYRTDGKTNADWYGWHADVLAPFDGTVVYVSAEGRETFAVRAGVDLIVHGMWGGWELASDGGVPADVAAILDDVAQRQIGYQPTIQVIAGLRDMVLSDYLGRPELADAYPTTLTAWYATKEGGWYADEIRKHRGFRGEPGFREVIARASKVTGILAEANAHLLFGSDTPSDNVYTNPPGLNGRLEMTNWIDAGVSKEKLFRALTIDNARTLRLDKQIGTVEPGKVANLLLLGANPLENLAAYDTIETVFLHGRPIPRAELSARKVAGSGEGAINP